MSKKLTIKRIAELAGVSKATVSRVLNEYPHIRPEVREQVQRVIAETGYQPNNVARSLASNRSNIIGLVVSSGPQVVFTDPYFPALTEGVFTSAKDHNLTLALFLSHLGDDSDEMVKGILKTDLLDGLIITADYHGDTFGQQLLENNMPFVYVGRPEKTEGITYVDTDNIGGGFMATQYMIEQGYRRIATIASEKNTAGDDRLQGYQNALEANEIPFNANLVAYGDYSLDSGYVAMKQLIPVEPDAVYIASDTMALGALRALREFNLTVPDDIAIISHDDLPPAVQADPTLTTVHQPVAETGRVAVELLQQIIDRSDSTIPNPVILPNKIVIRDSCGGLRRN